MIGCPKIFIYAVTTGASLPCVDNLRIGQLQHNRVAANGNFHHEIGNFHHRFGYIGFIHAPVNFTIFKTAVVVVAIGDCAVRIRQYNYRTADKRGVTLRHFITIRTLHSTVRKKGIITVVFTRFQAVGKTNTLIYNADVVAMLVANEDGVHAQLFHAFIYLIVAIPSIFHLSADITEVGIRNAFHRIKVNVLVFLALVKAVLFIRIRKHRLLNVVRKRNFHIGRILFQGRNLFGVPVNLVLLKASRKIGMTVCLRLFTRITATVTIHHVEYAKKLAALRDTYRVVTVPRQFFLFKVAIFGCLQLRALPVNALLTFVVVITKYRRPRDLEAVHKFDKRGQYRTCIVKFTVNNVTRDNDKIGAGFGDYFRQVIKAAFVHLIRCPKILFYAVTARTGLPCVDNLRIGQLQNNGITAYGYFYHEIGNVQHRIQNGVGLFNFIRTLFICEIAAAIITSPVF